MRVAEWEKICREKKNIRDACVFANACIAADVSAFVCAKGESICVYYACDCVYVCARSRLGGALTLMNAQASV